MLYTQLVVAPCAINATLPPATESSRIDRLFGRPKRTFDDDSICLANRPTKAESGLVSGGAGADADGGKLQQVDNIRFSNCVQLLSLLRDSVCAIHFAPLLQPVWWYLVSATPTTTVCRQIVSHQKFLSSKKWTCCRPTEAG